jgi:hypothetical protein
VYGGQDILNQDGNPEDSKSIKQTKILSVCPSMHEESTGFPFQKSTDEVGVKIDIRH